MSMHKNQFETKDLYLAAFLYAKSVKFHLIVRKGVVCWFVFDDLNLCEQLQQEYFSKVGTVIAKDFADALGTLKNLIFAKSY